MNSGLFFITITIFDRQADAHDCLAFKFYYSEIFQAISEISNNVEIPHHRAETFFDGTPMSQWIKVQLFVCTFIRAAKFCLAVSFKLFSGILSRRELMKIFKMEINELSRIIIIIIVFLKGSRSRILNWAALVFAPNGFLQVQKEFSYKICSIFLIICKLLILSPSRQQCRYQFCRERRGEGRRYYYCTIVRLLAVINWSKSFLFQVSSLMEVWRLVPRYWCRPRQIFSRVRFDLLMIHNTQ